MLITLETHTAVPFAYGPKPLSSPADQETAASKGVLLLPPPMVRPGKAVLSLFSAHTYRHLVGFGALNSVRARVRFNLLQEPFSQTETSFKIMRNVLFILLILSVTYVHMVCAARVYDNKARATRSSSSSRSNI